MYLLARWLITALAVMLAAYLVPGITVSGLYTALWVALVLGIINAIIRPILLLLTLPINLLTLGLFTFVLNGLLFWLVASAARLVNDEAERSSHHWNTFRRHFFNGIFCADASPRFKYKCFLCSKHDSPGEY